MKFEIERKFLIIDDAWRSGVVETLHLRDGLVASFGAGKVRVRIATATNAPPRAWVTLKGPRSGISRREFEYEIPVAEAETMHAEFCDGHVVEKLRHSVPHAGQVWQVDVYLGFLAGVVHAEVELGDPAQTIIPPPWLGPDVTGQPQHSKRAMISAALAATRETQRRQVA